MGKRAYILVFPVGHIYRMVRNNDFLYTGTQVNTREVSQGQQTNKFCLFDNVILLLNFFLSNQLLMSYHKTEKQM